MTFHHALPLFLVVPLLAACTPEPVDEDPPPIPETPDDTGEETVTCSGAPPRVTSFTASPQGLVEFEGGEFLPSLLLEFEGEDDDGDLTFLDWHVWWDAELDGQVDTSGAADSSGQITLSSTACDSFLATVHLTLGSRGNPAYGTWHDFALVIEDVGNLRSEPAFALGGVPHEDGSDPDPLEPDTGGDDTGSDDTGSDDTGPDSGGDSSG